MSAKDVFHEAVKRALEKEGWRITHDPLQVKFEQIKVVIDLGAEELIGAERGGREIAVEIKSFLGVFCAFAISFCAGSVYDIPICA